MNYKTLLESENTINYLDKMTINEAELILNEIHNDFKTETFKTSNLPELISQLSKEEQEYFYELSVRKWSDFIKEKNFKLEFTKIETLSDNFNAFDFEKVLSLNLEKLINFMSILPEPLKYRHVVNVFRSDFDVLSEEFPFTKKYLRNEIFKNTISRIKSESFQTY